MKKILSIIIFSLLLTGCFDQTERLIENCADYKFDEYGYQFKNDPLNIRDYTAKEKLKNNNYNRTWSWCEDQSKKYPKKFKAQFKD
ncbi:hypothetical protein [Candidatus Pelagibacter sp.]|uniref:hypothetical protein n=1 Tax=Candidatus Pelagibacter sp. TaxID=2024849 RepID=UPI003F8319AB